MALAIVVIAVGGLMVFSSLKGISISDAFGGVVGDSIDPSGGLTGSSSSGDTSGSSDVTGTSGNVGSFKGPNAAKLKALADVAVNRFDLKIGNVCRSAAENSAAGGSPTSKHLACRAFDTSGSAANMLAFARYVHDNGNVEEVFYDPAGYVAPGYDHSDHVHVGD